MSLSQHIFPMCFHRFMEKEALLCQIWKYNTISPWLVLDATIFSMLVFILCRNLGGVLEFSSCGECPIGGSVTPDSYVLALMRKICTDFSFLSSFYLLIIVSLFSNSISYLFLL